VSKIFTEILIHKIYVNFLTKRKSLLFDIDIHYILQRNNTFHNPKFFHRERSYYTDVGQIGHGEV
jgi:hypothetical protein